MIKEMSKDSFAHKVKFAVTESALCQLLEECRGLKKTACLCYDSLKLQDYFSSMYPSQARIVFKWRSETLDIKSHLTYKYNDLQCRCCNDHVENPHHIINCGVADKIESDLDILNLGDIDDRTVSDLKRMVARISSFIEKVQP